MRKLHLFAGRALALAVAALTASGGGRNLLTEAAAVTDTGVSVAEEAGESAPLDADSAEDESDILDPSALYVENEWDYVDGSMDITDGIPENAIGKLGEIREKGTLVVATEPYFAPQEFIDPELNGQKQFVGADMELAARIAERMGVKLEIVPMDFSDVLLAPENGSCDLAISGLAYTPGRASQLELSKGYHFTEGGTQSGILIREADAGTLLSTEDLAALNLVAQSGSLQEVILAEQVTNYHQFYRVSSLQEVYSAVQSGLADAGAVDLETADIYIRNNPDCGLTLMEGVSFGLEGPMDGDRVAGRKGELMLMYFVNGVIDEILENGEYVSWFREYMDYAARLGL